MIYARSLGDTLHELLKNDSRVIVLGEDILDPYGGAFKVTRGLSTAFPERVKSTPVSEQAIAGISAGLALAGYRPIAEIMFGDFISLCFDQILNHITKYEAMYNRQATCPVILRTPSGGGRAYGPTHSQSLEKHFFGIPHLRVVAASIYHNPIDSFQSFLKDSSPVLFIEHKLLYPMKTSYPSHGELDNLIAGWHATDRHLPTLSLSAVPRKDCQITILAYGYQATRLQKIIQRLAIEEELFIELLVPADLKPIDLQVIQESVLITGRLVTVEEGTAGWSWGSEIANMIQKSCFGKLSAPVEVLTSQPTIIPSAKHLEAQMLINEDQILKTIRKVI